ncbi:MAG TPA: phosphotransferase, partial [Rickettsiales bacterium]|nr:phosphotransferase [Rickettsiales bacterium]
PKNVAIYNHDLLFKEVMLFVDWYLIYEKKIDLNLARRQEFKRLWFDLFDLLNREDQTLVLRDFHADNLMLLKNNNVGLLDFQDAVIGSKAYDLVSLLEDARRDLAPNLASKMLQYFLQNSSIDQEKFLHDYEILSLQRNIKILGIFSRLARRDGKEFYLKLLPRVRDYVITRISTDSEVLQKISQFLKDYV